MEECRASSESDPDEIPPGFFDDLLPEIKPEVKAEKDEEEAIEEGFFDDLFESIKPEFRVQPVGDGIPVREELLQNPTVKTILTNENEQRTQTDYTILASENIAETAAIPAKENAPTTSEVNTSPSQGNGPRISTRDTISTPKSEARLRKENTISAHEYLSRGEALEDYTIPKKRRRSTTYTSNAAHIGIFEKRSNAVDRNLSSMIYTATEPPRIRSVCEDQKSRFLKMKPAVNQLNEQTKNIPSSMSSVGFKARAAILQIKNIISALAQRRPMDVRLIPLIHTPVKHTLSTNVLQNGHGNVEYHSILHCAKNVQYKYSSQFAQLNLSDWNLKQLPRSTEMLAEILNFDVNTLMAKQQSLKTSIKLKEQSRKYFGLQHNDAPIVSHTEDCIAKNNENNSSLGTYDKSVQAAPLCANQGTQTGNDINKINDIILQKMRNLNAVQQLAVNSFIALLRGTASSNTDLSELHERILSIYHSIKSNSSDRIPSNHENYEFYRRQY